MSKNKVQQIHEATLRILEHTGMKFVHPDAQAILREHGVRMEDDVAFFTPEQVMEWVGKAPSLNQRPPGYELKGDINCKNT